MNKTWAGMIAILITASLCGCGFGQYGEGFPKIGIVTASKLICRKEPSIKGVIKTVYNFSNPIILSDRSKTKETINGIEDYWYRDRETGGWVFGGYLIITKYQKNELYKLMSERIMCNIVCGGNSCLFEFEPYIIGDYFIAAVPYRDYEEEPLPYAIIVIGNFEKTERTLVFKNLLASGGYFKNGKWVDNFRSQYGPINYYHGYYAYNKVHDGEGEYYIHYKTSEIRNRKRLREQCGNKNFKEEVYYSPRILKKVNLNDCRKIITF